MTEVEQHRDAVAAIDKELNESGASIAILNENIRIRGLAKDIQATQAELDSYDMEEAGKAKRIFKDRYNVEKEKETQVQSEVSVTPL